MESTANASPLASLRDPSSGDNKVPEVNFAFLVNTQRSLGQNAAPSIDNQRLARQKRKRTSPEDHAILEAEYERNPKPDKTARQELVKRVALGEKEVQIWFQNRRQMTRRKSGPLLNQEVDVSLLSSQEDMENAGFSSFSDCTSSQQPLTSSQSSNIASHLLGTPKDVKDLPPGDTALSSALPYGPASMLDTDNKKCEGTCQTFKVDSTGAMRPRDPADFFKTLSQTISGRRRPGYFANRRITPFIIHHDRDNLAGSLKTVSTLGGVEGSVSDATSGPNQPVRRTTSLIKLSMDSEGKAEVMPRTGNTPSPPHPRPSSGLQRSFSAVEPGNKTSLFDSFQSSYGQRKAAGRSRDTRTWEFYCDSDARNALTEQAEGEERGSAAAAIDLIRSHSQSNRILTPNSNKRNAHVPKHNSIKRHRPDSDKLSKPKLGRTTSSVGRLQTTNGNNPRPSAIKPAEKHLQSNSQSAVFKTHDDDSDKENWEPGTQTSRPPRRRPVTSPESARILLESLREPSQSASFGAMLSRGSKKAQDKENCGGNIDDEVAAFMGETVLPREDEDLDCVHNLLKLSQAAWK
ncbi:MAG: hypothetical protein Q9217_002433 [Psora testacea]